MVGGGDSALEEAIFLTKFATKVTLVHRRDTLRASKIMQDRACANERIDVPLGHTSSNDLHRRHQARRRPGPQRQDRRGVHARPSAGLFVAIGHRPNTDLFKGILDMDENGYLVTRPGSTYTNVDGVFACGDVQDHTYRQAITAAGSGCMAAIDAERWLEADVRPLTAVSTPRRAGGMRTRAYVAVVPLAIDSPERNPSDGPRHPEPHLRDLRRDGPVRNRRRRSSTSGPSGAGRAR